MLKRFPSVFLLSLWAMALVIFADPVISSELTHRKKVHGGSVALAAESKSRSTTFPVKEPKRGGTLTIAAEWDISTLHPFQRTFSVDEYVRNLMYDSLLSVDLKDNIQPNLAESWEASRDGMFYTFRLRRGVKFHNGQEMTADDVRWSINYVVNPKNGTYGRQRILMVDRAEAVDRYTVRVHLNRPHAGFLAALTQIKASIILPKGAVEEGAGRVDTFPPGTGPFRFAGWKPNDTIVFDRFNDYWGPHKALLDRVVFRPIPDETVRFTALRAGDVDMIRATPYDWATKIERGELRGIVAIKALYAHTKYLFFNVAGSFFENLKLRQAVAHAIDRKEIIDGVFRGFAAPMDTQTYPRSHKWYIEGVPSYPLDPGKAKRLLKEAGYKGEEVELLLTFGSEDQSIAQVIHDQLRRIGMNVNIKVVDVGAREEYTRMGQYQMDLRGGNFYPDVSDSYLPQLACDEKRISNRTGYCDKSVDELFARADSELNEGKRRELYKELLVKVHNAVPIVRLLYVHKPFALHDYVKGFTVDREGRFRWVGGGVNTAWLDK
jgi:ABC-type transport system substrate-binding protein